MSSDCDYSDEEEDYYDDDDDMMSTQEDAAGSAPSDEDMDVDGFNDDFRLDKGKNKSYQVSYDSLSQSAIEQTMKQDVDHISSIFGVDESTASLLLRFMRWNKERLIEKYMDNASVVSVASGVCPHDEKPASPVSRSTQASRSSGPSAIRRVTRRTSESTSKSSKSSAPAPKRPEPFVCSICFDDSQTKTLALSCDHVFCADCWQVYIISKVREEAEHCIRCMAEGCSVVCPDTFVLKVIGADAAVAERFHELLVRHYVACNANLKYCPYPSCTFTVSCPSASSKSSLNTIVPIVTCGQSASHCFCFGCTIESDHRPVICAVARLWLKKCHDDSETANWIKSHTKECSNCHSTIEKNGGCNHMTCKKCRHEFCWVCMGPWAEHGTAWYSCNRFDDKTGVDARDAQSKSRASLERYLHYYNRWANHEQSIKLSVELYAKTEKKMEEMQITSELTYIEVQFMRNAVDEVKKCRTTLKWTYAMAYYLEKGNQKELFEDNQRDLEKAVEDLSELLESPIEPHMIGTLRQKVTDKTVYVRKRNEIMLEDTAVGFSEGRWKWNTPVDGFEMSDEE